MAPGAVMLPVHCLRCAPADSRITIVAGRSDTLEWRVAVTCRMRSAALACPQLSSGVRLYDRNSSAPSRTAVYRNRGIRNPAGILSPSATTVGSRHRLVPVDRRSRFVRRDSGGKGFRRSYFTLVSAAVVCSIVSRPRCGCRRVLASQLALSRLLRVSGPLHQSAALPTLWRVTPWLKNTGFHSTRARRPTGPSALSVSSMMQSSPSTAV